MPRKCYVEEKTNEQDRVNRCLKNAVSKEKTNEQDGANQCLENAVSTIASKMLCQRKKQMSKITQR